MMRAGIRPWAICLLLLGACASGWKGSGSPSWVLNPPHEAGMLFAVGTCGRTRVQADAWVNSSDAARSELAKNIQAHVQNAFLHVQSSSGENWADEAFVIEATSSATDAVMDQSQIVALWYDEKGVVPGSKPGTTYALAVMRLSAAVKAVEMRIENKVTPEQREQIIHAIEGRPEKE